MASQIVLAQAVVLRSADNTNDSPEQGDLDDVQAHWDSAFGGSIDQAMLDAGIADTPTNRALVQMFASLSPGTPSRALASGCRFFKAVNAL